MKSTTIFVALVASAIVSAAPISPMEGYRTTDHSSYELDNFWRDVKVMDSQMKGKDCFKRAMLWSYKLDKDYGVASKKIFLHYTDKFNRELDDQGRRGISARLGRIFSGNAGWDFHVAPAVTVNGKDYVLDPQFRPGPESVEDWLDSFMDRGEALLKKRHLKLLKDLRKYERKALEKSAATAEQIESYQSKAREIRRTLDYLGLTLDPNQKVDIKCKKITHIMEFDANQFTEWCYYQETNMYYYGPLELRFLNYGNIPVDQRYPVRDLSYHTEEYFQGGRNYVELDWPVDKLKASMDEYHSKYRPDSYNDI